MSLISPHTYQAGMCDAAWCTPYLSASAVDRAYKRAL